MPSQSPSESHEEEHQMTLHDIAEWINALTSMDKLKEELEKRDEKANKRVLLTGDEENVCGNWIQASGKLCAAAKKEFLSYLLPTFKESYPNEGDILNLLRIFEKGREARIQIARIARGTRIPYDKRREKLSASRQAGAQLLSILTEFGNDKALIDAAHRLNENAETARNILFERNRGLVTSTIGKMGIRTGPLVNLRCVPTEEMKDRLREAGESGLLIAVDIFNPKKKTPFAPLAVRCIRTEVRGGLKQAFNIAPKLLPYVQRYMARYTQLKKQEGCTPTPAQVINALGIAKASTRKRLAEAMAYLFSAPTTGTCRGWDEERNDTLEGGVAAKPLNLLDDPEKREQLQSALEQIPPLESYLVGCRLHLNRSPMSRGQISDGMNVSKKRAEYLEDRGFGRLFLAWAKQQMTRGREQPTGAIVREYGKYIPEQGEMPLKVLRLRYLGSEIQTWEAIAEILSSSRQHVVYLENRGMRLLFRKVMEAKEHAKTEKEILEHCLCLLMEIDPRDAHILLMRFVPSVPDPLPKELQRLADAGLSRVSTIIREGTTHCNERYPQLNLFREEGVLTERQMQVLRLLAEGKSSTEIAGILSTGRSNVRNIIGTLRKKLGAENNSKVVPRAREKGWID